MRWVTRNSAYALIRTYTHANTMKPPLSIAPASGFSYSSSFICCRKGRMKASKLKTIKYLLVYAVISLICIQGINCFQRFSEQPKYTEVNPGQDALLTCKVIDKRGTCSWQKDNKPVGIYAKKYEWAARPSTPSGGSLHLDLHPPPMQIGGDCSLWIRSATLDFDDGLWECQVTASDFTTQDALTSQPVRLVVRVAPQRPRLEYEGTHVPPGHNITVDSGSLATAKCVSHYGNPPATLKWFLGDQEIEPIHLQTNITEPDNPRTWSATSVVQLTAMRERHGDILRCLAFHESYTAKSVPVEARLDIKYAPTIRLIGSPEIDLEEDKDALVLRCVADANPPASIVWRRAGRSEIASLQETLQLRPVGRRDAGLYTCQAQNSVGTSEQLSVQLDVKYPPKILSAGPDRLTTAPLFSPAAFECVADGNPMPTYKWVQRISHGSKYVERGHEPRLVVDNVTYDYQGEYECRATNYINGQERVAISEPVSLQVVGAPQILRLHPSMHTVLTRRGDAATLTFIVCADPRPQRIAWEWGSLRLDAGSATDRFRADDLLQDAREDCYLSTLHIHHTNEHDARPYYLVVENERGSDRHAIQLNVEEPLEMSYLLGTAGGCLAAIFILICLCIYALRVKKCCFKGSSGYKSSDKDSEKADLKSRSDSTSGPQGDSIYTTPAGFHHQQQQQQQQVQSQSQQLHHQQQAATTAAAAALTHNEHGSPEAMKPTNITTSVLDRTFDNLGNFLWHQEAEEFVEKYPQKRRSQLPTIVSSTLYNKPSVTHAMKKRSNGGELLTPYQRHQRDMFSGDLGIPEISSHVGSMVHTFETMALQREITERQRAQRKREHSEYLPEVTNSNESTPTSYNRGILTLNGTSNKKLQQLKKKSHDSRQKVIQHILLHQDHLQQSSSLYQKHLSVNIKHKNIHDSIHSSTSNSEVYYKNIDNDYRKNYICNAKTHLAETESYSQQSEASQIVTKAFEEVLANYEDLEEDEEESEGIETRRVKIFSESETGRKSEQFKKPAPLLPKDNITSASHSSINKNKHKTLPFNHFIKYLKASSPSTKLISASVAKMNCRGPIENSDHIPRVTPPSGHLLREVEGDERGDKQKQNFLRGSSLSHNFVHQLRVHKPHQKAQAPPIPLTKLTTSQALRQILLFPKRLKHSVEFLPEDGDVMNRKHYGKLEGIKKMEEDE
ncbi:irregular chiasm C-roughest protein isoform X2 [Glossina fuscipes]|uniref:Irregular chiasm C-roughest protein isoform X2 n=1 Tax=Glossina fuscipes TaxID=7396 RepID=A0A9C5ZI53_9MUSC|nr:irregular chiasm C-roughest protein isoform X2 [Glossina fuscipes]